jgi:hypothetical protein
LILDGWEENQEYSLDTFNENAPLVSIRDIKIDTDAPDSSKERNNSGVNSTVASALPSTVDLTTEPDTTMDTTETAVAATDPTNTSTTTTTIAAATATDKAEESTSTLTASRPKRNTSSRTVDMMVEGVGVIKVSKFSLDTDEYAGNNNSSSSNNMIKTALDKRAARRQEQQAVLYISHSGRQVAGRDFEHQDMCNECWDGGDLLVCDMCPMAFHLDCIGLKCMPKGLLWLCPHHSCATCSRRVSAAALLFR